jgi:hypothetical protein
MKEYLAERWGTSSENWFFQRVILLHQKRYLKRLWEENLMLMLYCEEVVCWHKSDDFDLAGFLKILNYRNSGTV